MYTTLTWEDLNRGGLLLISLCIVLFIIKENYNGKMLMWIKMEKRRLMGWFMVLMLPSMALIIAEEFSNYVQ
jgi:hypothetical protein